LIEGYPGHCKIPWIGRAVKNAGLAADQQGLNLMYQKNRKDSDYRVRLQDPLPEGYTLPITELSGLLFSISFPA